MQHPYWAWPYFHVGAYEYAVTADCLARTQTAMLSVQKYVYVDLFVERLHFSINR